MQSNFASLRAGHELEQSMLELRSQIDRYLIKLDLKQLESIPRFRHQAANALNVAERESSTTQERHLMLRTRAGFDAFFADYDRLAEQPPTRDGYADLVKLMDQVYMREVLEPTREYMRLNEGMLAQSHRENEELTSRVQWALVGLGLSGVIGGALGGWMIALGFRRRMRYNEARLRLTTQQLTQVIPKGEQTLSEIARRENGDVVEEIGKQATAVIERLQQTERDALRAEQLAWVGQMAAGIAHEVRNPLMAIKMLIQVRADRKNQERLRPRDLQILQDEIVRMEEIISTFLNFARPPRLDKAATDIGTLIAQVVSGTQARAASHGVNLEAVLPTARVVTQADGNQLRQVLYNLVFNALDVQTGGTVRLRLTTPADEPETLVLEVEDEGPGIPSEIQDRMFEPFVSTKDTGMGLGLSICRRIVEGHGGQIEARNRMDRPGAVLTVLLPVVDNSRDGDTTSPIAATMVQ